MIEHNRCHKCGAFVEDADTCAACLEACRCAYRNCERLGVCFQPSSRQYFCVLCAERINREITTQAQENRCIFPHRWGADKKSGIAQFDTLLEQWHTNEEEIRAIQEKQHDIVQQINQVFTQVLEKNNLLASFPWEVDTPGRFTLWCKVNSPQVLEFFSRLEWDDNVQCWYHHSLKFGEYYIHINDGDMEISFESLDELVAFCQKNGIKPSLSKVMVEKQRLDARNQEFDTLISRLG